MRRLLPPLLVGLLLIVLFALSRVERPIDPLPVSSAMIGWACIPVALIGLAVARRQFSKASAEIMTFDTPRNLVTDGLFAYSRNPMYLSMLLLVLGAALIAGHWAGLLMPLVFFIAVPFEESAAEQAFGDPYRQYRARVRRWI
ncbi:DUF1295 domain-containing protein [Sinorhizobium medicae]|nr:DUF1295 domain-containing protein [Sinorhizobium medicae]